MFIKIGLLNNLLYTKTLINKDFFLVINNTNNLNNIINNKYIK